VVALITGDYRRFWGFQALGNPSAWRGQCLARPAVGARFTFLDGGASVASAGRGAL